MIKPLRTLHAYIWTFFALALPALFVAAIIVRPASRDELGGARQLFDYTFNNVNDSLKTVTLVVRHELPGASGLVYGYSEGQQWLIGTVAAPGRYTFPVPVAATGIFLFDNIRKTKLANTKGQAD